MTTIIPMKKTAVAVLKKSCTPAQKKELDKWIVSINKKIKTCKSGKKVSLLKLGKKYFKKEFISSAGFQQGDLLDHANIFLTVLVMNYPLNIQVEQDGNPGIQIFFQSK